MHISRLIVLALAAGIGYAPAASAAALTPDSVVIGSFFSEEDFFGVTFRLQNDSERAGVRGTFADVNLLLNGGAWALFGGAALDAGGTLADTFDTSTGAVTDGVLSFIFRPEGLPEQDYRFAFGAVVDPPEFFEYARDSDGGGQPVPEPATVLLLGAGALGLAARGLRTRRG